MVGIVKLDVCIPEDVGPWDSEVRLRVRMAGGVEDTQTHILLAKPQSNDDYRDKGNEGSSSRAEESRSGLDSLLVIASFRFNYVIQFPIWFVSTSGTAS